MKQYEHFRDSGVQWRIGVRAGYYVRDKTLTATGFSGVEDTDWTNIYSSEEP